MAETFTTKVVEGGRITIPEVSRAILDIKVGSYVRITVEPIKVEA